MGVSLCIGLIGCGAIGNRIAKAIDVGEIDASLSFVVDLERKRAEDLVSSLRDQAPEIVDINGLLGRVNLIVEAASSSVVPELLKMAIRFKTDCMIMSVGGLLGLNGLMRDAQEAGIRIHCPSGAIAGLDALASAAIGRIDLVRLTTIKPPKGLSGAPFIIENNINLEGLKIETVVFEGNAFDACGAFPKNVNVAAALSLAGIGAEKTMVRIIADPDSTRNMHQVEVEGEFGRFSTITENLPSPCNPRTSYLASLSAVSCLKRITDSLIIGG